MSLDSANSVKTFRENSIEMVKNIRICGFYSSKNEEIDTVRVI